MLDKNKDANKSIQSNSKVKGDQTGRDKNININNNININIYKDNNDSNLQDEFSDEFESFLNTTELSNIIQNNNLTLWDIYIPVDLNYNDSNKINIEKLASNYVNEPKNIVISGNDKSGKTSCLKYFIKSLSSSFLCVYIPSERNIQYPIDKYIINIKNKLYKNIPNDLDKTILFIDDFHKLNSKKANKLLKSLKKINNLYVIITVDDVFNLKIEDVEITKEFHKYHIKSLGYVLRDRLINTWLEIIGTNENDKNKYHKKYSDYLESTLFKSMIPSYPFFLYTILGTIYTTNKIDNNITSQGYCYQALITISLLNANIKNSFIDSYYNILTELSFYFYKNIIAYGKKEISEDELRHFLIEEYDYKLPEDDIENILINLNNANLFVYTSTHNYYFKYKYIYYFFLGKYFADHFDDNKNTIYNCIDNLHIISNSYVIIFILHHSKNYYILEHLQAVILCSFDKYRELKLDKDDFDDYEDNSEKLINMILDDDLDSEKNKEEYLSDIDKENEQHNEDDDYFEEFEDNNIIDKELVEIRKSIRIIEVMGHILKNRHGSIKSNKISEYFDCALELSLRIGKYLFDQMKNNEKDFYNFFIYELKNNNPKNYTYSVNQIENFVEEIFYRMNIIVCYATVKLSSDLLCSEELIYLIEKYNKTPITSLIEKEAKMIYKQSIDICELEKYMSNNENPQFLKNLLRMLIYEYLYFNKIEYKERQRISAICKFNSKDILTNIHNEEN